jgi:hypothetical protein
MNPHLIGGIAHIHCAVRRETAAVTPFEPEPDKALAKLIGVSRGTLELQRELIVRTMQTEQPL